MKGCGVVATRGRVWGSCPIDPSWTQALLGRAVGRAQAALGCSGRAL